MLLCKRKRVRGKSDNILRQLSAHAPGTEGYSIVMPCPRTVCQTVVVRANSLESWSPEWLALSADSTSSGELAWILSTLGTDRYIPGKLVSGEEERLKPIGHGRQRVMLPLK